MTNPEQRLIVTDLDGTLLHDAPHLRGTVYHAAQH